MALRTTILLPRSALRFYISNQVLWCFGILASATFACSRDSGRTQERAAGIAMSEMCCFFIMQIQNARDKLQGKHPSDILLAELAPKHSSTKHWAALQVMPCFAALRVIRRLCKG